MDRISLALLAMLGFIALLYVMVELPMMRLGRRLTTVKEFALAEA